MARERGMEDFEDFRAILQKRKEMLSISFFGFVGGGRHAG
jgi:hypothetical protein